MVAYPGIFKGGVGGGVTSAFRRSLQSQWNMPPNVAI